MILDYRSVSYTYDLRTEALSHLSASFGPGIHLLLGPNGAGKSTMLKVGAGLLDPSEGKCFLDKEVMSCHDPHAVKQVFLLTDSMRLPLATIGEMVRYHAPFYSGFSAEALERNLSAFGLSSDTRLDNLSLGNRHKANVAYALALGTETLMLDEPANGLDMASKEALTSLLVATAEDREVCIIVATHTVQEMRNIFDTVTILNHGSVAFAAPVGEIMEQLAFVNNPSRLPEAIFYKEGIDGPNQIVPVSDGLYTPVDYRLLYLAATAEDGGFRLPDNSCVINSSPEFDV